MSETDLFRQIGRELESVGRSLSELGSSLESAQEGDVRVLGFAFGAGDCGCRREEKPAKDPQE